MASHTDLGTLTILMQDTVGGLQVYHATQRRWIDVKYVPDAFIVNVGDVLMQITNDVVSGVTIHTEARICSP